MGFLWFMFKCHCLGFIANRCVNADVVLHRALIYFSDHILQWRNFTLQVVSKFAMLCLETIMSINYNPYNYLYSIMFDIQNEY